MQNWVNMMLNFFGYKKKNRSGMWFSIIGIVISAAAALLGFTRGRGILNIPGLNDSEHEHAGQHRKERNFTEPNLIKNVTPGRDINVMNNAALAELSDELLANALKNDRK